LHYRQQFFDRIRRPSFLPVSQQTTDQNNAQDNQGIDRVLKDER
jgi:hypothetical protein